MNRALDAVGSIWAGSFAPWDPLDLCIALLTLRLPVLVDLARLGRRFSQARTSSTAHSSGERRAGKYKGASSISVWRNSSPRHTMSRMPPAMAIARVIAARWPALAITAGRTVYFTSAGTLRWRSSIATERPLIALIRDRLLRPNLNGNGEATGTEREDRNDTLHPQAQSVRMQMRGTMSAGCVPLDALRLAVETACA